MDENLWKIYDANKEWIKFADTKAIAFIAIIGVIFNILTNIGSRIIILDNYNIIKILYIISIIFLSISLLLSICCLMPQKSEVKKRNIIYYESISTNFRNGMEYQKEIEDIENFTPHLSSQIYKLAKVASGKYFIVKISLILFGLGILSILLFFLFLFLGWSFNV